MLGVGELGWYRGLTQRPVPFWGGFFVLFRMRQAAPDNNHWTHRLFVEEAEVYLPFLELAMDRAEAEVGALEDLFARFGLPPKASVLDVACGIGRHSVPLAQRGYRVTGIDISPLYVQRAKDHASVACVEARFLIGDMGEAETLLNAEEPFAVFISMFTSHGYRGKEADLDMFRQLRHLAAPGALLVVLTANRDWLVRNFEPEGLDIAGSIRILQNRVLDLETSMIHNDWAFFEGEGDDLKLRLRLEMEHRVYSLHELKGLLEEAGWQFLTAFGSDRSVDLKLGELTYDSQAMWVVCRTSGTSPHNPSPRTERVGRSPRREG